MPERMLPRQFETPPELFIPLSNAELQELGTFTAIWSQIDWLMMMIIAHLTKTELGPLQLMTETMTTGPRVNLLKKLCHDDPNDTKNEIKKLCESHSGLIEDRNHIIHGIWAIEWDYGTARTEAASLYQKNKRKPIPATKLTTLSGRAAEFSNGLGRLLEKLNPIFAGDRPRPFFFGEGDPRGHQPPPWPPARPV